MSFEQTLTAAGILLLSYFGGNAIIDRTSTPSTIPNRPAIIQQVFAEEQKEEELTLEQITAQNYTEKVYQNQKPVIVVHTGGMGQHIDTTSSSNRMKKVLLELKKLYANKIDFYEFNYDAFFPELPQNGRVEKYAKMFYDPRFHKKLDSLLDMQQVTYCPSTFMYHREDILTGKKHDPEEPNFLIDILKGGPTENFKFDNWIKLLTSWIEYNLENKYPELEYVYRYENAGKIHKVYKTK